MHTPCSECCPLAFRRSVRSWLAPVIQSAIAYLFLNIEQMCIEIEGPFGRDPNGARHLDALTRPHVCAHHGGDPNGARRVLAFTRPHMRVENGGGRGWTSNGGVLFELRFVPPASPPRRAVASR
eukprot:4761625-Prymnesium_polylepis.3